MQQVKIKTFLTDNDKSFCVNKFEYKNIDLYFFIQSSFYNWVLVIFKYTLDG